MDSIGKSNLSEAAKKHKKEYMKGYNKKTGYAAQKKYQKANTKQVLVRLFLPQEQALYDHLQKQENKNAYIKRLIAEDMSRSKKTAT